MVRAATDRERNHKELHSDSQFPGEKQGPSETLGLVTKQRKEENCGPVPLLQFLGLSVNNYSRCSVIGADPGCLVPGVRTMWTGLE